MSGREGDSSSLLCSKSNSVEGKIDVKNGPGFSVLFDQKNDNSSKYVCSFGPGPICLRSLGQDLSRNASVVSVYAF